jgi:hypothetical protein
MIRLAEERDQVTVRDIIFPIAWCVLYYLV